MRRDLGGTLDPHASWLVLRGMKTMAIRVRAQNENAMALAGFLSEHRKVKVVHYPGLETTPAARAGQEADERIRGDDELRVEREHGGRDEAH